MHKVEEENERGVDETCVGVLWYERSHVNMLPVSWEGSENHTESRVRLSIHALLNNAAKELTKVMQERDRACMPSYRTVDLQLLHAILLKAGAIVSALRNEATKSRCRFLKMSRYS